jgi:hypothetical protein
MSSSLPRHTADARGRVGRPTEVARGSVGRSLMPATTVAGGAREGPFVDGCGCCVPEGVTATRDEPLLKNTDRLPSPESPAPSPIHSTRSEQSEERKELTVTVSSVGPRTVKNVSTSDGFGNHKIANQPCGQANSLD